MYLSRLCFVVLVGLSCQAQSQSGDYSNSLSSADTGSVHENPCSFRGKFLLHDDQLDLDPCTSCVCSNGTTICEIESCHVLDCRTTLVPEICCRICRYKMVVLSTNIVDVSFKLVGDSVKYSRFSLDISVKTSHSTDIIGENLWKLSAWISTNADGNGTKYALNDNIFSEQHAAKPFKLTHYPPWKWKNLYYHKASADVCDQCKYMCVKLGKADDLETVSDLSLYFQPAKFETKRLIDCVSFPERKGIGCAYEGISFHDKTVIRPDNCTECMCLNGTVNCTKENCDVGTDVPEEYYPSHSPTQTDDMTSLYTDETEDGDSTRPTLPTIVIVILSLSISLTFLLVILLLIRRKMNTNSETNDYSLVLS
ncbi:uncharacterized protein [Apostichopus japonicus]|uniref:uncharacterized protein isoform X2 n=1 Tax=Stichopus japonicus TaxID=307972 RepID=UPI003AB14077